MQTLLEGGSFFEAPRWHERRWWVSDFYRHVVRAIDPDGRSAEHTRTGASDAVLLTTRVDVPHAALP